jgi:predicted N-acyltransferase
MDRRDASGFYYFPRSFFERLVADLKGRFAFFHAIHRGTMISTELVLESAHSLYSFLGGSLAEWYHLRPNDLLKHMIIKWGVQRGKHAFVLGGGYAPGDGICRYKRSFAPKGERGFYVAKIVFDPVAYQLLLGDRRRWEASQGNQWEPDGSFFPLYRGRVK